MPAATSRGTWKWCADVEQMAATRRPARDTLEALLSAAEAAVREAQQRFDNARLRELTAAGHALSFATGYRDGIAHALRAIDR